MSAIQLDYLLLEWGRFRHKPVWNIYENDSIARILNIIEGRLDRCDVSFSVRPSSSKESTSKEQINPLA
jgi:hypothetical protein